MTNKERLAALQAQREEINRQIRILKTEGVVEYGPAKLAPRLPGPDGLWTLSYAVPLNSHYIKQATQYRSLFTGARTDVIAAIPTIIDNLRGLYNAAVAAQKEEEQ